MADREFDAPPEADILDKEFEVILHYTHAISHHYPVVNYYLDRLLQQPDDQWVHTGKLPPEKLRELGREIQRLAGHQLALGGAVLRWADRCEHARAISPPTIADSLDQGWTLVRRTVAFIPIRPKHVN